MEQRIKELLRGGEGSLVDYKLKVTSLEKIARTMVAFANNKGGTILVGVDDKGRVVGVNPDEEVFMLNQAAASFCSPAVDISYECVENRDGNWMVLAKVAESRHKTHLSMNKKGEWQFVVRADDKSMSQPNPNFNIGGQHTNHKAA